MTIRGIPHHMLDILNPDEEFNVAIFKDLAEKIIGEIHSRDNIPFLVGGSTMYIDALVYNYNIPRAKPNNELRKKLEAQSNEKLFGQLIELDPDAEWTVDKNNKRRLIRALEVCIQTGEPFTKQKTKRDLPKNVLYLALNEDYQAKTAEISAPPVIPASPPVIPASPFVIPASPPVIPAEAGIQPSNADSGQGRMTQGAGRKKLYDKINKRVDEMMAEGFLDEVKKLHKKYDLDTALQATGYKQLVEYLEDNLTLEEAVEKTKQSHRNYAKRQLTWLRRNQDVVWIKNSKEAEKKIEDFLKNDCKE